jgi:capsular exopolysaccharide synthesis family protein
MNTTHELTPRPNGGELYRTIKSPAAEKELTLKDLWRVFLRRRTTLLSTLAIFLAAAVLICVFSTRRYLATAELQVQRESSAPLGLGAVAGSDSVSHSDAIQDTITIQTQVSIVESDSLALKVIHDLNLASTQDFEPKFSTMGWLLGLISPAGLSDTQFGAAGDQDQGLSPRRRKQVLSVFAKNLKVKPVVGTRLIDISYLSPDPRLAAEVANHLAQSLKDYNFQTRHNTTAQTAEFLTGQLSDLRTQSEALQAKFGQLQRESGVLSLGGVDAQGREQVYSAVLDKLQQATAAYTQAESNRIAKAAEYEVAKNGDPESISRLSVSSTFAGSAGLDSSLALIQNLRMQQATLEGQLAQESAKFGYAFPKLAETQQQLAAIDNSIKSEVLRIRERTKNDYQVAQEAEENTRKVYQDLRQQADALNDKTIAATLLRQEADQSRTLYETLFKQLKEAGVLADFRVDNTSIVDPARVPADPAKPNVLLYLLGSIAGGLFVGPLAALLRDSMDNKIQDLSDLETELGQISLRVLPFYKGDARHLMAKSEKSPLRRTGKPVSLNTDRLLAAVTSEETGPVRSMPPRPTSNATLIAAVAEPRCAYAEAVRGLRTSLLLAQGGAPPKVILVTSSVSNEGKSMLSLNLAALLAQQGKQVLLVDGDLRRPGLHSKLQLPNTNGLSTHLAGICGEGDAVSFILPVEHISGLHVATAGPPPPFPAELLGSEQMRDALGTWRKNFDFVVIDGSPLLPVTDSLLLSALADFTLLMARHNVTEREALDRSYRLLKSETGRHKIGLVLNAVKRTAGSYQQYYGYEDASN